MHSGTPPSYSDNTLSGDPPQDGVRELLHLGFHQYQPAPALRPWVHSYWSIATHVAVPRRERLYPDGGSSIVCDFTGRAGPELRINAFHTLSYASLSGSLDLFGVRLQPGGAFSLFGLPAAELIDQARPLQDLPIQGAGELFERMCETAPRLRPQLMDAWLLKLPATTQGPGLVQRMLPAVNAGEERLVQALSRAGIGRRSFERLFSIEVGLAPSQLKLLLRVRKARFLIKTAPWLSLSEIAQHCGYFDQAHFTRQFKRVAGTTPGEYRNRQLARMARGELLLSHRTRD